MTVQDGTNPLGGSFTLTLDARGHAVMSSDAVCTTGAIAHNAWPSADESNGDGSSLEEILEATKCIGDVSVNREDVNLATTNGGYAWLVTFHRDADLPCQQPDTDGLCNSPGDVPKLSGPADDNADLLGTNSRDLVHGDGYVTRGAVTILDAGNNSTRPPGTPEVQIIRIYDLELTASDKFETHPGFVLHLGGNLSGCIAWNASASDVAAALSDTYIQYAENVQVRV